MYVYIESEHNPEGSLFTVGFYDPSGKWHPESDHDKKESAAKRTAWLNGNNRSIDEALNMGAGTYKP